MTNELIEVTLLSDGGYECLKFVKFPVNVVGTVFISPTNGRTVLGYDVPIVLLEGLTGFRKVQKADFALSGSGVKSLFFSTRLGEVKPV